MENREQIKQYIKACEHMIKFFTKFLDTDTLGVKSLSKEDKLKELTDLRYEIKKDTWPEAESPKLTQSQKSMKLFGELISTPVKNKNILEFGCCDCELSSLLKSKFGAKTVVAFRLEDCQSTDTNLLDPNVIFTDKFRVAQQIAPFDIIILNDVIDHLEKPVFWIKQLAKMLSKETGRMFVRCHPWLSRNGTHLSEQMNKAFLHLMLSDDELGTLGVSNKFTRKITDGMDSYKRFFEESNLKILNHKFYTKSIEVSFLKNQVILERIKKFTKIDKNLLEKLEVEFIDFELKA